MDPNSDLIDLLHALNEAGAKYLLVGGYAFALHGRLRATKDADLFIGADRDNALRVWHALQTFGAPLAELRPEDLAEPGTFFIMGRPPNQIDVITEIDGISFDQAWQNRVEAKYGSVAVWYISRDDLIVNKEAAGRPQDRLDVAFLKEEKERG